MLWDTKRTTSVAKAWGAFMQIELVINARAGGALGQSLDDLERNLARIFEAEGHGVRVSRIQALFSADRLIEEAIARGPDALVIAGGDGTVLLAARRLENTSIALGIVPMGTINRLARDLGIPLSPVEAASALSRGTVTAIDAGAVNGALFLCNSLIGLPPRLGEERQKLRGKPPLERMVAYFGMLRTIFRARRRMALAINSETETRLVRALSVAVSNNPYSEEPSLVLHRPALNTGKLGLYISKHRSGLGLLWVLLKASLGRWSGDPALDRYTASQVTIQSRRRTMRVSNDGEIEELDTPLRYRIKPLAIKVLVPDRRDAR
jgi:diacylglycerol kinase family enzyme